MILRMITHRGRRQEHFSSVLNYPEPEMLHDFEDDSQEQDIPTLDTNEGQ